MKNVMGPVAALFLFPAVSFAQDQPPLQRHLQIIAHLFPGSCDNNEQVYFDNRLKLPEHVRHERVSTEVRRIPDGRFGEHAFFIMDYWHEQDSWHPRIYSFHIDGDENAIRMRLHAFVLYAVERSGGKDRNMTYSWGAPEEASVGINLIWMITSYYITPTSETEPYLRKAPAGPWQSPPP